MNQLTARDSHPIANPYLVGRPLTRASANLFVGRSDVFTWFAENLVSSPQPNALLLYGRRRIGKTSTLYQLVEGEHGRQIRENQHRPVVTAYVDLQRYAGRHTEEWLRRMARDICQGAGSSSNSHTFPETAVAGETAYTAFDRCMDRLEETLPDRALLLIVVDEFEQIKQGIETGSLGSDIVPFLRSQIQHRQRIAFLVAGAFGLLDPFWNSIVGLLARYELGMLNREETISLVRDPLTGFLEYEDEAIEAIWQQSAGHPYLVQNICHRLVSMMNRRHRSGPIQLSDVEHVLAGLAAEGFDRQWLESSQLKMESPVSSTSMEVSRV